MERVSVLCSLSANAISLSAIRLCTFFVCRASGHQFDTSYSEQCNLQLASLTLSLLPALSAFSRLLIAPPPSFAVHSCGLFSICLDLSRNETQYEKRRRILVSCLSLSTGIRAWISGVSTEIERLVRFACSFEDEFGEITVVRALWAFFFSADSMIESITSLIYELRPLAFLNSPSVFLSRRRAVNS